MPKISVIVPVYNTAKYLAECLDSVVTQTFSDIEIICINDGSTDNSQKILDKYARKDKRIVLLNQKNSGVSAARNLGVKYSKSKYIYPLDSDDVISPNTLEKLYNAMLADKGDIITCRVKYFGKESGEMHLMPPTKYNMVQANCLVNAALFRKSDFYLSGEYRNTELEDYDLWLNMLFNHNKKIYRVPEILFCYRIKDKIESRNASCDTKYKDITNALYRQYPSIKTWLRINKLTKPFIKFARFVFRIENNKIKIFKIPIRKIRKYDVVISVGAACFVPQNLKELKLRDFSGPFDWMYGSDVITRLKIIKNKFQHYFDSVDFEYIGENPDNDKSIYKNNRSGLVYNHDFPKGNFKDVFPKICEKYTRRINRVLEILNQKIKVLLIYSELGETGNKQDIIKLMNGISDVYNADIDLLYINHKENIKLKKYVREKRISKHVLYAEYHYSKFPKELSQAKRICKRIIKRVAL